MTTQERILMVKKARLKLIDRINQVEKCRKMTGKPVGEGDKKQ